MRFDPAHQPQAAVFVTEPLRALREGIGVNVFLGRERNCPPTDRADLWEQIEARLDEANPGFLRIGYLEASEGPDDVSPWDDARQEFLADHDFWRKLERLDAWCRRREVNWMLDPWWVPRSMQVPPPQPDFPAGKGGPRDPTEYARHYIRPLLEQVRNLGLGRCRYLGLLNEPIWGELARDPANFFVAPGQSQVMVLKEMYRAVRDELDRAGFGQIGLVGPGHLCAWQMPPLDFMAAGADPSPFLEAWDMHAYFFRLDWMEGAPPDFPSTAAFLQQTVRRWVDFASQQGKPFFITEMGSFYYGRPFWGDRDHETAGSHTAAISDAQMIVRALQLGVDGFLRWAWSVPAEIDGRWSLVEWDGNDGIQPSPCIFPVYKALMNAIPARSEIFQTRVSVADANHPRLHATAVRAPDGRHRLVLVHDTPGRNADVRLYLGRHFAGRRLKRVVVDEVRKGAPMTEVLVPDDPEGFYDLMLTPFSVTVLAEER